MISYCQPRKLIYPKPTLFYVPRRSKIKKIAYLLHGAESFLRS